MKSNKDNQLKLTQEEYDDMIAEIAMNNFIDAQERAAKRYWDSVIEW